MPFHEEIQNALHVYDHNKGFWRRLFRRDQAAIRALRSLDEMDQTNHLKVYHCFIKNLPKPTQASYQVYQAVLNYLDHEDFSSIPKTMDQLYAAKFLKITDLEKLNKLEASQFQTLATTLEQLNSQQLLTRANFDAIAQHIETVTEEAMPTVFNSITHAVTILSHHNCLNQDNFNYILEKPHMAANIAKILSILNQTDLLTPDNLSKLRHPDNQFLLSDEADPILWSKFKDYLNRLLIPETNQAIFDTIIEVAQQENPNDEIMHYMAELNSQFDLSKRNVSPFKFSTTPTRGSQELLNIDHSLTKSGTW